jgi:cytochrome c biogenesis factor
MFFFPMFWTVYIPIFAMLLSILSDRLIRSLRHVRAHAWLPATVRAQRS